MYLLRRLGANLIDGLLFVLTMVLTGLLCTWLDVIDGEFEVDFSIFSGLLAAIVLPVLVFSSTIGEKVFRLHAVSLSDRSLKIGLLLKYIVIYCFVSLTALNVCNFFRDILATYTIFPISEFFIIRVLSAVLITNAIFFLLSLGRCSLFDKVLGIRYGVIRSGKWYLSAAFAAGLFVLLMVQGMIIDWKIHNLLPTKKIIAYGNSATQIRLPPEDFDRYTVNGRIYCRVVSTDFLVTTSDWTSFVQDKFLYQRQIEAEINDSLMTNADMRHKLCEKMLNYCYGLVGLADTNRLITQTKIELVHMHYISPFIGVSQYFIYYFDDTASRYGLYGGFNWDTLNQYYIHTKRGLNDSLAGIISVATSISKDSAAFYLEHQDTLQLARLITPAVLNWWVLTEVGPLIDRRIQMIRPIQFDSVKSLMHVDFWYGYAKYPIFSGPFYDTQEIGAIGMRNSLGLGR